MVDWKLAQRVGVAVGGGAGAGAPLVAPAELEAMAARAAERVSGYARLEPAVAPPQRHTPGGRAW